jgi:hypothetical protein
LTSIPPLTGSSTNIHVKNAKNTAGAALTTNGTFHPYFGPTAPDMICPNAIPAPVAMVKNDATFALVL